MDTFGLYFWPLVGGLVLFGIISLFVRAPGAGLSQKFVALGNLQGRSYSEIVAVVGAPSAISATADGGSVRQWMASGYHIALLFDANEVCLGVSHEASV